MDWVREHQERIVNYRPTASPSSSSFAPGQENRWRNTTEWSGAQALSSKPPAASARILIRFSGSIALRRPGMRRIGIGSGSHSGVSRHRRRGRGHRVGDFRCIGLGCGTGCQTAPDQSDRSRCRQDPANEANVLIFPPCPFIRHSPDPGIFAARIALLTGFDKGNIVVVANEA